MDIAVNRPPKGIDLASEAPLRLGAATVDPVSREAQFPGGSERLQPQNLKVLVALARERGAVVTRERLVDLCWDGRFVGDDVINRSISTLRQFAERAGGFRIETVPRSGYRLVEDRKRISARRNLVMLVLAIAGCAAFAWLAIGSTGDRQQQSPPKIGLLPFTVASNDPATRELASSAHDSLADALSATQFQTSLIDSPDASREPVDFLLSGDVTGTRDSMVVTIRIVERAHHALVYSQRFSTSRADAGALAERIGPQVIGSIDWKISHLMVEVRQPPDPFVTTLILRESRLDDVQPLNDYADAQEVVKRAPGSPLAQIELAFAAAFVLGDLPQDQRAQVLAIGRNAALRTQALAPDFGEAYVTWCVLHSRARIAQCESQLRHAMRIDSSSTWPDWTLASVYIDAGLMQEAVLLAKHSLARDPFTQMKIALRLRTLDATGQTAEADDLFSRASRWWPRSDDFFAARISGLIDRGDYAGIERFEKRIGKADRPSWYEELSPIAAAVRSHSPAGVKTQCPVPGADTLKSLFCISALAQVGELDRAFAIAAERYPVRVGRDAADEDRIFLAKPFVNGTEYVVGAGAAPLRRDPRYIALAERVGLLAYWRSGRLPDFCRTGHPEDICSRLR